MRSWMGLFLFGVIALTGATYEAHAVDVNVGVGVGRRSGGSFSFSTNDSAYTTWYPQTSTYVYTPTYPTTTTTYVSPYSTTTTYYSQPYTYTTRPTIELNTWYGSGRYRDYRHHDRDHDRRR